MTDFELDSPMIEQYIRRRKRGQNRTVGYLVARNVDGNVFVGYSLCGPQDHFTKPLAWEIADGRCFKKHSVLPPSIVGEVEAFLVRSKRYFKDAISFPEVTEKDADGDIYLCN